MNKRAASGADLHDDLDRHRLYLKECNQKRQQLQLAFEDNHHKILNDASNHAFKQQEMQLEIENLKLKLLQENKEKEDLRKHFKDQINAMADKCEEDVAEKRREMDEELEFKNAIILKMKENQEEIERDHTQRLAELEHQIEQI